jgi:transposase
MTKAYRSNLTWEQWELIAGEFPSGKVGGRPRNVALFAVVNAIFYVLCEGCTWRGLPGDFPAWQTVYGYFWRWNKDGTWLRIQGHSLSMGSGCSRTGTQSLRSRS